MSIKLQLQRAHAGCPEASLAASLQQCVSGGEHVLGKSPWIAKHAPHVQEGPLHPPTTG